LSVANDGGPTKALQTSKREKRQKQRLIIITVNTGSRDCELAGQQICGNPAQHAVQLTRRGTRIRARISACTEPLSPAKNCSSCSFCRSLSMACPHSWMKFGADAQLRRSDSYVRQQA